MTLAPRSDKIMKRDNETFPNLFDEINVNNLKVVNNLNVDNIITTLNLNAYNVNVEYVSPTYLSLLPTSGILTMVNCNESNTAGTTSGFYLPVNLNGTPYKIRLYNDF